MKLVQTQSPPRDHSAAKAQVRQYRNAFVRCPISNVFYNNVSRRYNRLSYGITTVAWCLV